MLKCPTPGGITPSVYCAHIMCIIKKNVRCPLGILYVVGELIHTKAPEGGAFDSQLVKSSPFPHPPLGWEGGAICDRVRQNRPYVGKNFLS